MNKINLSFSSFFKNIMVVNPRMKKWTALLLACAAGALAAAFVFGWSDWVSAWIGSLFKASSGAGLGFLISRYLIGLNLSSIDEAHRPAAGIAQAIVIVGIANAVALGY